MGNESNLTSPSLNPSYWHCPDPEPMRWVTLPQLVDEWADRTPDAEAYVVRMQGRPRESLTFKELKEKTEALAAGLLNNLGLTSGDFVIISGICCINWLITDLACASIGVRTIRCRNTVLTKEGIHIVCQRNNVKALFYHPGEHGEFEAHLMKCMPGAFQKNKFEDKDLPLLQHVIRIGQSERMTNALDLSSLYPQDDAKDSLEKVRQIKRSISPDSIYTVFMTSGSSGFPKAVPVSHYRYYHFYGHARVMRRMLSPKGSRFFNDRCLAWVAGMTGNPLLYGCTTVYVQPLTTAHVHDVDFCIQVLHEEKVTTGLFLQYLVIDITERIQAGKAAPFKLPSMMIGGDVITPAVLKMLGKLTDDILYCYASTEGSIMASNLPNDMENTAKFSGFVEHGMEVKIVDEKGQTISMGQEGEICIRSPYIFRGYLQEEAKGMVIDEDGWMHTEDAGSLHAKGYLRVLGRRSSIIRGATITFPFVVEKMMIEFEGVSKVTVIGVPDPRLGENICACVVPKEGLTLTEEKLLQCFSDAYQTDEGLGMTPAYFMFLEKFPIINSKCDRKKLRAMAIEHFGLSDFNK